MANVIILKKKLDEYCISTRNALEGRLHHTKKSNGGVVSSSKKKSTGREDCMLKIRAGMENVFTL